MAIKEQGFDTSLANQIRGQFGKIGSDVSQGLSAIQEQKDIQEVNDLLNDARVQFDDTLRNNQDRPADFEKVWNSYGEKVLDSASNGRVRSRLQREIDDKRAQGLISIDRLNFKKNQEVRAAKESSTLQSNIEEITLSAGMGDIPRTEALLGDYMNTINASEFLTEQQKQTQITALQNQLSLAKVTGFADRALLEDEKIGLVTLQEMDKALQNPEKVDNETLTSLNFERTDKGWIDKSSGNLLGFGELANMRKVINTQLANVKTKLSSEEKINKVNFTKNLSTFNNAISAGKKVDSKLMASIEPDMDKYGTEQQKEEFKLLKDLNENLIQLPVQDRTKYVETLEHPWQKQKAVNVIAQLTEQQKNDPVQYNINNGAVQVDALDFTSTETIQASIMKRQEQMEFASERDGIANDRMFSDIEVNFLKSNWNNFGADAKMAISEAIIEANPDKSLDIMSNFLSKGQIDTAQDLAVVVQMNNVYGEGNQTSRVISEEIFKGSEILNNNPEMLTKGNKNLLAISAKKALFIEGASAISNDNERNAIIDSAINVLVNRLAEQGTFEIDARNNDYENELKEIVDQITGGIVEVDIDGTRSAIIAPIPTMTGEEVEDIIQDLTIEDLKRHNIPVNQDFDFLLNNIKDGTYNLIPVSVKGKKQRLYRLENAVTGNVVSGFKPGTKHGIENVEPFKLQILSEEKDSKLEEDLKNIRKEKRDAVVERLLTREFKGL